MSSARESIKMTTTITERFMLNDDILHFQIDCTKEEVYLLEEAVLMSETRQHLGQHTKPVNLHPDHTSKGSPFLPYLDT